MSMTEFELHEIVKREKRLMAWRNYLLDMGVSPDDRNALEWDELTGGEKNKFQRKLKWKKMPKGGTYYKEALKPSGKLRNPWFAATGRATPI